MMNVQYTATSYQIKIATSWLFLLLAFGSDGFVAFQFHPSRQHRHRIPTTIDHHNNYIYYKPERWILERRTLQRQHLSKVESTDGDEFVSSSSKRRNVLHQLSQTALLTASTTFSSPLWNHPTLANAATTPSKITNTATPNNNNIRNLNFSSADTAKITHKVFFNVRISRPDGTFYVRDEDENDSSIEPENRVYYGQLTFGLFGVNAPNHVQRFLEYVVDPTTSTTSSSSSSSTTTNDEAPYPSYSRSSFTQFDDATGILYGGTIPSLEVVEIQQSVALRYGNRLLPAKLWIEPTITPSKIAHDRMGLLTHGQFDATPVFGITTRNDTTILNPTHTVFGTLILNGDAKEFLHRISTIPTYSIDRPIVPPQSTAPPPATDAIYNLQREFFRNTAKTLGDTRINKLYNGKLLRRVEVTQVGLL